jgi:hypothetical protein
MKGNRCATAGTNRPGDLKWLAGRQIWALATLAR